MGSIVKMEHRFFIVFSSLLAGCVGGWWYFEDGSTFSTASRQEFSFGTADAARESSAEVCWSSDIREGRPERNIRIFIPAKEVHSAAEIQPEMNVSPEILASGTSSPASAASLSASCPAASRNVPSGENFPEVQPENRNEMQIAAAETSDFARETAAVSVAAEDEGKKTSPVLEIAAIPGVTMDAGMENTLKFTDDFQLAASPETPKIYTSVCPAAFQVQARNEFPAGDFEMAPTSGMVGSSVEMASYTAPASSLLPGPASAPTAVEMNNVRISDSSLDRAGTEAAAALASLPDEPATETPPPAEVKISASAEISAENSALAETDRIKTPVENVKDAGNTVNAAGAANAETAVSAEPAGEVKLKEAPRKYALRLDSENIRKALAAFQTETGLKVVASLDVQGLVSCDSECEDPEVLLGQLLAGMPFQFVRSGKYVYVAHSDRLQNLPEPLELTETQTFIPENVSADELELVFRSNLSQFGTCERIRDAEGRDALRVTDWVLTLRQLEEVQKLLDAPAPENRMSAYVFQHEVVGNAPPLQLQEIADNRGLVIQRMQIPGKEEAKKTLFTKLQKKEPVADIQAYSISFRADTFMIGVKDQLNVAYAPMKGAVNAPMLLETPMNFEFGLNVNGEIIPYALSLTFCRDPNPQTDAAENAEDTGHAEYAKAGETAVPILAEVVCRPLGDVGEKSKPRDVHFRVPMPLGSGKGLIFQLNLGEFAHKETDKRLNPAYVMAGNRVKEEVVVVFNPYKQAREAIPTNLSTAAVNAIIHQQEVLGRKFYGSMDLNERQCSSLCFGIAQRLRQTR